MAAYDFCQHLRAAPVSVISGFHGPMESECLRLLLRSKNRHIMVLARGPLTRLPSAWKQPVEQGRLVIEAPFPATVSRPSRATCEARNRIVADQADTILIVHCEPGSMMQTLGQEWLESGKRVVTFQPDSPLLSAGGILVTAETPWSSLFA